MNDAIGKVINIAKNEAGYLEKASNSQLDSKTGNVGSNNYTKYARDLYHPCSDMFVDWCFVQAFGQVSAKQLLGDFLPIRQPARNILNLKSSTTAQRSREIRSF